MQQGKPISSSGLLGEYTVVVRKSQNKVNLEHTFSKILHHACQKQIVKIYYSSGGRMIGRVSRLYGR